MGAPHSKDLHSRLARPKRSQSQRGRLQPTRIEQTQSLIESPAGWEPAPGPPNLFRSAPNLKIEAAWDVSSIELAPRPGTILNIEILDVQSANLIRIGYIQESGAPLQFLVELNGIIVPDMENGTSKLERSLGTAIRDYIGDLLARAEPIYCRFERASEYYIRGDFLLGPNQESLVQHLLARGMVKYDEGTPPCAWSLDEMRAILRLSMN